MKKHQPVYFVKKIQKRLKSSRLNSFSGSALARLQVFERVLKKFTALLEVSQITPATSTQAIKSLQQFLDGGEIKACVCVRQ